MKLRKTTDVSLDYHVVYELLNASNSPLLDVSKTNAGDIVVSINQTLIEVSELIKYLETARDAVESENDEGGLIR